MMKQKEDRVNKHYINNVDIDIDVRIRLLERESCSIALH